MCVCLLLQDLVQSCLRGEGGILGGGDIGGHVLRETTSRGLCGLVCPSRTSEPMCVFITAGLVVCVFITVVPGKGGKCVCVVFITAVPITKLFARGGGGEWRTCATRDYEPRPM
jgi:hypothetical protein